MLGLESDVEHLATDNIGVNGEGCTSLADDCLAEHSLATCVTAHAQKGRIGLLGEIFACGFANDKTGLGLEGNDVIVNVVVAGKLVYLLLGQCDFFTGRYFNESVGVLAVGCSRDTPVTFVILQEHTHRDFLARSVLQSNVEQFTRGFKVTVHGVRKLGALGVDGDIYRVVTVRGIHDDVAVLAASDAAVLH